MAARLVVIFLPDAETDRLEQILPRRTRRYWRETVPGGQEKFSCIVQQRYTELRDSPDNAPSSGLERFFSRDRNSISELYDDIAESIQIRPSYLLTVALSSMIAGLGMGNGQTAVVIGAMIIAPLLGPTMGMALATTLGDWRLGIKAAVTLIVGSLLAILVGGLTGMIATLDPNTPELLNRTIVSPADIAFALATGAAGVLAFSRGSSLSLVGVMIAVALVPPLAATGIYAGLGHPNESANALFLFAINLVCIMVAGIIMFLLQGLQPRNWRLTGGILAFWVFILALLASLMAGRFLFSLAIIDAAMGLLPLVTAQV